MKKIAIYIIVLFCSSFVNGQQEILLSKYTVNNLFFNPAYAGSHGKSEGTFNAHYRNQWMGFEGAPQTIMLGGEYSMMKNTLGLGVMLSRESIGVEQRSEVTFNTAYRVKMGEGQLAGGIRVGFMNFGNNFSKLTVRSAGDIYDASSYNITLFSVGSGLYYNTEKFYMGVSVPTIAVLGNNKPIGERRKHFYFNMGTMLGDEDASIRLEPNVLLAYSKAAPLQYSVGGNIWFSQEIALGALYRSDDAVSVSGELYFQDRFKLSVAYDITLSSLRKFSDNSLEFAIGYRFNTDPRAAKLRYLRYQGGY
jgi:type IX secretion system PorP/SprF family membrane protein